MRNAKAWAPSLEVLEDRLTPALTYIFGGGSLFVLGSTANTTVTVTSNAGGVTVADGALSSTFAVTGTLSFNILMTAAKPVFNYDPGVTANGSVLLNVNGPAGLALNVAGTSNVNINGPLLINTGAGNDSINIDNVNPAGLFLNTGAGYDTVLIGYNAPVTVRGPLNATDVELFGLGNNNQVGPPVVVQGLVSVNTGFSTQFTDVDVEPEATIQGSFFASAVGDHPTVNMGGTVLGDVFATLGNSSDAFAIIPDGAVVGGDVLITAAAGASTTVSIGTATIGGNVTAVLGNGTNVFVLHATVLGSAINYFGGAGTDRVTFAADASAPKARLTVDLGAGDDTFTLNSNALASAFIDGGTGNNTFISTVVINFPITLRNF